MPTARCVGLVTTTFDSLVAWTGSGPFSSSSRNWRCACLTSCEPSISLYSRFTSSFVIIISLVKFFPWKMRSTTAMRM